mgnify:FL=1
MFTTFPHAFRTEIPKDTQLKSGLPSTEYAGEIQIDALGDTL